MVQVLDDGVHPHVFVIDKREENAEAALAERRILRPAERLFERPRVLHAREDDALRAGIERARHQRIEQFGNAYERGDAGGGGGGDQVLRGFHVVAAVLHIDEEVVETGGREESRNLAGAVDLHGAAEDGLALTEAGQRVIGSHGVLSERLYPGPRRRHRGAKGGERDFTAGTPSFPMGMKLPDPASVCDNDWAEWRTLIDSTSASR